MTLNKDNNKPNRILEAGDVKNNYKEQNSIQTGQTKIERERSYSLANLNRKIGQL